VLNPLSLLLVLSFGFTGTTEARSIVRKLAKELLAPLQATKIDSEGPGVDIEHTVKGGGVPGFLLRLNDKWWYEVMLCSAWRDVKKKS